MKFRFIWIGKTKDRNWKALQEDYLKRLSHFVKCEIIEIKDSARHENAEVEGKRILETLNPKTFAVLLDVSGKQISSHQLSAEIEKWQNIGIKEISFIIGGFEGASIEIRERADYLLSLSFLTFTHEMARVVLLEQLYRGYSILKGFPYQK
ncbi:MAG TPA: 23S rRNA (pseudouridine(1915)-N(3))-methyltransferase RlmH [Pyrinomonadaceae bacterium]|nr:23S rRNA (pseudouridine(1915)-N(3))-methyltransferase RlmH [Pyrinomonadaceae bacterium]